MIGVLFFRGDKFGKNVFIILNGVAVFVSTMNSGYLLIFTYKIDLSTNLYISLIAGYIQTGFYIWVEIMLLWSKSLDEFLKKQKKQQSIRK